MDRRIISLLLLLLSFEIYIFSGELGLHPYGFQIFKEKKIIKEKIGNIKFLNQSVKQKHQGQFFWKEPKLLSELYQNDSILTLNESSAKISLEGNIEIEIQENTLITISNNEKEADSDYLVQFAKGSLRSFTKNKTTKLESKNWSFKPQENTEFSIRSTGEEELQIDVSKGTIELIHKGSKEAHSIGKNESIRTNEKSIKDRKKISNDLVFDTIRKKERYYISSESKQINLKSPLKEGKIKISNNGEEYYRNIKSDNLLADFSPGSYALQLVDKNKIGPVHHIDIILLEEWYYLTPLPRTRIKTEDNIRFSWVGQEKAFSYKLEFTDRNGNTQIVSSLRNKIQPEIELLGPLSWRVYAYDEEGFPIPAPYFQKLFRVKNLLEAPKIRSPLRVPANKEIPQSKWVRPLEYFYHLFIPRLHAQSIKSHNFEWEGVPGADYYIIEIASDPGFRDLLVTENIDTTQFIWRNTREDIVYWRVAGAKNSGDMGYFSTTQKKDLAKSPKYIAKKKIKIKSKNINPKATGTIKPNAPLTKLDSGSKLIPEQEVVKIPTENVNPKTEKTENKVSIPPSKYSFKRKNVYFGLGVNSNEGTLGYENTDFNFTGLPGFHFGSDFVISNNQRYQQLKIKLSIENWEAKNQNILVEQSKIQILKFQAFWKLTNWSTSHKFLIKSLERPLRTGFTSLDINQELGIGYAYDFQTQGPLDYSLGLALGKNSQQVEFESTYNGFKAFGDHQSNFLNTGAKILYQQGTGSFSNLGINIFIEFILPKKK
ncbi:MAG: hypothetical protein AB8E15_02035 [Bdellovibrionales bacterium]